MKLLKSLALMMLASTAVVFSMDAAGVSAVSPVDGDDTGGVPLLGTVNKLTK